MVYGHAKTANNLDLPESIEEQIQSIAHEMGTVDPGGAAANQGLFNTNVNNAPAKMARNAKGRELEIGSSNSSENREENQRSKRFNTEQALTEISQSTSQVLARIDAIDNQLAQLARRRAELEAEQVELETEIARVEQELAQQNTALDNTNQQITEVQEGLVENQEQEANLTVEIATAEETIEASDIEIANLTDQISDNEDAMELTTEIMNDPNALPAEIAQANRELTQLEEEQIILNAEIERHVIQRAHAERDKASLQTQLNTTQEERVQLQAQLDLLLLDKENLENDISVSEQQLDTLTTQHATNELELNEIDTQSTALELERAELEVKKAELIAEKAELAEEIARVQTKLAQNDAVTGALQTAHDSGASVTDAGIYEALRKLEGREAADAYAESRTDEYKTDWAELKTAKITENYETESGLDNGGIMGKREIKSIENDMSKDDTTLGHTQEYIFQKVADSISGSDFGKITSNVFDKIGDALDASLNEAGDITNKFNVLAPDTATVVAEVKPEAAPLTNNIDTTAPTMNV